MAPLWTMTDDTDKPPSPVVSLAVERAARERDFSTERADLTRELAEIGVAEDKLAAWVQHIMEIESCFFQCVRMFGYHGVEQHPQAIVELAKIMARDIQGK
jgi:hypothetical protein